MLGRSLSHYAILEKIGSGGMGDVYRARDTHLDREVALKVLPQDLSADPVRRDRFQREAKALAALNHPNIVVIHSVEEAEGVHFMTMELVRGETLAELLGEKAFTLDRFFDIAIPLADAIAAAHEQGITHRDLKPQNVMVDGNGRVKVLDFGLAKLVPHFTAPAGQSELPTEFKTADGQLVGTVSHMSPEQAEGKPVDHRTDIFSLGVIFYELVTGERPFTGASPMTILSAILTGTPPDVTELNRSLPPELGRITSRCLNKDPERRFQTAKDLRNALVELQEDLNTNGVAVKRRRDGPRRLRWISVPLGVAMAASLTYWLARSDPEQDTTGPPIYSFEQVTSETGRESEPSLSPDGNFVIYAKHTDGQWDIYRQRLGGQRAFNLTDGSPDDDTQPAFSPDGELIAFRSERDGGGIFLMGATGESVTRLTDFGYDPAWSPDGKRLAVSAQFSPHVLIAPTGGAAELWLVDVATGDRELLVDTQALQPSWSPNGHRIAFWAIDEERTNRDVWTIPTNGGQAVPVTDDPAVDWNPMWSADGRYLYFSSDRRGTMNLWRVPVEETSGELRGEPEPVTTPTPFAADLSRSSTGERIAYAALSGSSNIYSIAFDPSSGTVVGEPEPVTRRSGVAVGADPSPDGQTVAFMGFQREWDIFVIAADGSALRNLTRDAHNDRMPRWSPDGERIAFYSSRTGVMEIWTVRIDGSGLQQVTHASDEGAMYPVWSPDGSRLAYRGGDTTYVRELDASGQGGVRALESPDPELARFNAHAWSPDGRWLAGELSAEEGSSGIVLYSFASGELVRLTDFGWFPRWLNDSRRLIFQSGDSTKSSLFIVDRESGDVRELYRPRDAAAEWVAISQDGRTIFFTRTSAESDIWVLDAH